MEVKIHYLNEKCKLLKDSLNSGYDLKANLTELVNIAPGERRLIPTGVKLQIPLGYEAQVRSRSGLALNNGIHVLNSPGTIDAGYRGEVGVILHNAGHALFVVQPYDRIAQLVFASIITVDFIPVNDTELSETKRGVYGFGSSGTAYVI